MVSKVLLLSHPEQYRKIFKIVSNLFARYNHTAKTD
nr:MAG TPA_asm: hypothetical protein [Caudoviricetes sp.]